MTEQDAVLKWINRLTAAEKVRNDERDRQKWLVVTDEYRGSYAAAPQSTDVEYPPINGAFSYVQTEKAKLYFRDPYITCNPKGRLYIMIAKLMEAIINYVFVEINVKKEVNKALNDALMVGHGWLKFGYTGTFADNPAAAQEQALSIEQVMGQEPQPPVEVNEFIKSEECFVVHVPWQDVLFDNEMAIDPPYDCRWIAHRIIRPLDEVKQDPQYYNTDTLKANVGAKELNENKGQDSDMTKAPDNPLVEIFEIHDKMTNSIVCVAKGHDMFLCNKPNVTQMEGLPFTMLKFNDNPNKPYPLSDLKMIEAQLLQRIRLRAIQLNHIKRHNRQIMAEAGSLTPESLEKLEQGVDGAVIEFTKGYVMPKPLDYAAMQAEIFTLDNLIQRDMDATIGQLETERGGEAKTETGTLGELQNQLQSVATRSEARQDRMEDMMEEVARKVIQLLKQFQTTERYVAISGMDPNQLMSEFSMMPNFDGTGFVFTKDDIQGEVDIEVKAGSMQPMNKKVRSDLLMKAAELAPSLGFMPGGPVMTAIGREIFRDMGIKALEQAFDEETALKAMMPMAPLGGAEDPNAPPQEGAEVGGGGGGGFQA